ncbi:hypothetical protein [Burkholderia ubonensis]|uniref:hypothetical protein n=1 Tax=Burkholderia ubonensis TaxID=101571 RepID=UPI000757868C|nr:hypothetical protein [Burkholderia ubonensis]KVC72368.1 hypothetical protein WI74_21975 [Burkholderia ubonensis]
MMATGEQGPVARWFARETRGLLGGFCGGIVGSIVAFAAINRWSTPLTVASADSVSIANTYIVYTTFVIAAVAALLAIAGLIFTEHFSMEKDAHIENAFKALLAQLATDEEKAVKFVKELMKNPGVVQSVSDSVEEKLSEIVARRKAHAGQRANDARNEKDALDDLSS